MKTNKTMILRGFLGLLFLGTTLAAPSSWCGETPALKLHRQTIPQTVLQAVEELYSETRHNRDFGGISFVAHFKAAPGFNSDTLVEEVFSLWIEKRRWDRLNTFCSSTRGFRSCLEAVPHQGTSRQLLSRLNELERGVDDDKSALAASAVLRSYFKKSLGYANHGELDEYFFSTQGLNVDEDLHILINSESGDILVVESDLGA